eukprot:TRINITY_DN432_c0_g1_i1.p1 TRINITY_DN432_c0_g1~~TRINITY_DN432_c0_g1_i1.p1  ORF type:complete len:529 (-),score=86.24 TRINITY_DN432_c0_g1_i1:209-1762(-)
MASKDQTNGGGDVEMKDATPTKTEDATQKLDVVDVESQIADLVKAVQANEPRHVSRVVRKFFTSTRKHLNGNALKSAVELHLRKEKDLADQLQTYIAKLPSSMEVSENKEKEKENDKEAPSSTDTNIPEVGVYLSLVVTVALVDNKLYAEAAACSSGLVKRILDLNRRTANPLAARAFFYYSRSFELCDRLAEIRQTLLNAHRISSLRHDDETHATILNLLLRNYLHYNLVDQADKLQAKTNLDDSTSANQLARFRYYQGRIKAIQLDYTGAHSDLEEALRKAPQNTARGFHLTVQKFACIVQLLMGELPDRSMFRQKGLKTALKPYLQLTQAVRVGDLDGFHTVVKTFESIFREDKTLTLIQRLRHNVIKTGLRKISISYSRIPLGDICKKLHLDNAEDVEFIVAKAIRDGVIDATIDHEGGFIQSKENVDVYSTQEPLEFYHARINFCLKMHNEAVKAMRYPPEAPKPSIFDKKPEDDDDTSPAPLKSAKKDPKDPKSSEPQQQPPKKPNKEDHK